MHLKSRLCLSFFALSLPASLYAQSGGICPTVTCAHTVTSSGANLTQNQALSSYATAKDAAIAAHNDAACTQWCSQQSTAQSCPNGTYTHHHPPGDNGVQCSSENVGGQIGDIAADLIGGAGGGLFGKISKKVKQWTCSRDFHFRCSCSGESDVPAASAAGTVSDPLLEPVQQ